MLTEYHFLCTFLFLESPLAYFWFQKEVSSVTNIDLDKEDISKDNKNNKDINKNG